MINHLAFSLVHSVYYMCRHEDPIAKEQEKIAQKGGKYASYVASGPMAYPCQAHARGLVGHLTVGAATNIAVRALDKVLPDRDRAVLADTDVVIVVTEETFIYE